MSLQLIKPAFFAAIMLAWAAPAAATDGEILITQQKAIDGTIPGTDGPGFPITISRPGAYKFAGDIIVNKAGTNGIAVNSHDVTIDFNGFRLSGASLGNVGIISSMNSLTIKNGMIALFTNDAIRGSGPFWIIDGMRIVFNGHEGIEGTGDARQWIISNSQIVENGGTGIYNQAATAATIIRNNQVNGNDQLGIYVSQAHIEGNMVAGNGTAEDNYDGILIFKGMVLGNTITDHNGRGIQATSAIVGFGNNTLSGNNRGGGQTLGGTAIHPNVCNGAPC